MFCLKLQDKFFNTISRGS